ncbi:MAG TPA: Plug domain-containing protein, partial [Prolixibacteraceae bacterium]|nr:Plug domain-containing protein [Prolixibacteraceae bacterium]
MKKSIILLFITIGLITRLSAQPLVETDTIKNYRLDEITVKSPKYNSNIFNIPAAATMMPSRLIENYQVRSLPEVSGVIPNFFMPDYGSKLTSPVYIRGIGTRINSPSVGLYLDNIPFFEK